MAAASKPTGVHYALVVFVLISIVCGLGWLLAYKGSNSISDLRRELADAKQKETQAKKDRDGYYNDIANLKKALGINFEEVGEGSNPNSVMGKIDEMKKAFGKGGVDATLSGAMAKQESFLL